MIDQRRMEAEIPTEGTGLGEPKTGARLQWVGYALTGIYLVLVAAYCVRHWDRVDGLTPDALANALGGVCAPLAFLWLVLGFLQQGHELRNSAKALWLQSRELQLSVEQQRELVEVTREQLQHERQRATAAEEEAERRSQPKFLLRPTGSMSSGGRERRTYSFDVSNAGAPCTDLRVEVSRGQPLRYPSFATGARLDFNIEFKAGDFEELLIPVTYIDARGMEQHRSLRIVARGETLDVDETHPPEEDPRRFPAASSSSDSAT